MKRAYTHSALMRPKVAHPEGIYWGECSLHSSQSEIALHLRKPKFPTGGPVFPQESPEGFRGCRRIFDAPCHRRKVVFHLHEKKPGKKILNHVRYLLLVIIIMGLDAKLYRKVPIQLDLGIDLVNRIPISSRNWCLASRPIMIKPIINPAGDGK